MVPPTSRHEHTLPTPDVTTKKLLKHDLMCPGGRITGEKPCSLQRGLQLAAGPGLETLTHHLAWPPRLPHKLSPTKMAAKLRGLFVVRGG